MMTARHSLLGTFEGFVELLACPVATWAVVLLVAMALERRTPDRAEVGARAATISWLVGTVLGLLLTSSPLFTGPLAHAVLAHGSIGYVAGALAGGASLAAVTLIHHPRRAGRSACPSGDAASRR